MSIVVHTYRYSVYGQIVRMALVEAGHPFEVVEVDPFEEEGQAENPHPFGYVPTVRFDGFEVYETRAILHFINARFMNDQWGAKTPEARARVEQVMSIVDAHGYQPLVRQVFSNGFFRARMGEAGDDAVMQDGLQSAQAVLGALEQIAAEGLCLNRQEIGMADLHLAPMVGYFRHVSEARAMMMGFPVLSSWFDWVCARASYRETCPRF